MAAPHANTSSSSAALRPIRMMIPANPSADRPAPTFQAAAATGPANRRRENARVTARRPLACDARRAATGQISPVTSATFIWNVLGLGLYMASPAPRRKSSSRKYVVITEIDMRSLLMKVLKWFIDHEGIRATDSYLAFVGRDANVDADSDQYTVLYPSDVVGDLAEDLLPEFLDQASLEEFEACMLRIEEQCDPLVGYMACLLFTLRTSVAMTFVYLVFMFICDVAQEFASV